MAVRLRAQRQAAELAGVAADLAAVQGHLTGLRRVADETGRPDLASATVTAQTALARAQTLLAVVINPARPRR